MSLCLEFSERWKKREERYLNLGEAIQKLTFYSEVLTRLIPGFGRSKKITRDLMTYIGN